MNIFCKFKYYPFKFLLAKGVLCLILAYVLVAIFSFKNIVKFLKVFKFKNSNKYSLSAIVDVVDVLRYRFNLENKCLILSIMTYLLAIRYLDIKLHIGVQKDNDNNIIAHSWIEDESGKCINGTRINYQTIFQT